MPNFIIFDNSLGDATSRNVLRWGTAPAGQITIQATAPNETAVVVTNFAPPVVGEDQVYQYNEATGALTLSSTWHGQPEPDPPSLIHPDLQAAADRVNIELRMSDWTQLPDANLTAQELTDWNTFRAALRAVLSQSGNPANYTWPDPPAPFEEYAL